MVEAHGVVPVGAKAYRPHERPLILPAQGAGIRREVWAPSDHGPAVRALKGGPLRQAVYAEDGTAAEDVPYTVTATTYSVRRLQGVADDVPGVFLVSPLATVSHHLERDAGDPRVTPALTLAVDDWGNVTRAATIAFPRRDPDGEFDAAHTTGVVTVTESAFMDVTQKDHQRVDSLLRTAFLHSARVLRVSEFAEVGIADIEDLFDVPTYLELVNRVHGVQLAEADLPPGKRVVKRVEAAQQAVRSLGYPSPGTIQRLSRLFDRLNALVAK